MFYDEIQFLTNELDFTGGKYNSKQVFSDVVTLEAYFINACLIGNQEYAKEFDKILEKYTEKERMKLWDILKSLAELYQKQEQTKDILGEMYNRLKLSNNRVGQFFTPTNVSDMMSKIVGINKDEIEKRGYITLQEPCVGAGGMVISYAKVLQEEGYNPHNNLFVIACDINRLCTFLTYVQLSMYDIPAIVVNGDTLAMKENFTLYTPQYYRGLWGLRKTLENLFNNDDEKVIKNTIEDEQGQMNLWSK